MGLMKRIFLSIPRLSIPWPHSGDSLFHTGLTSVGLLILTLVLLSSYLSPWSTPLIFPNSDLGTDLVREAWPLARLIVDSIHKTGELPLWRPFLLSGAPLIGHPVAPVFYPPAWLVLILPLPLALNLLVVLHVWWMAWGTYLYLRSYEGVSHAAALLGCIVFAQSPKWFALVAGGHWISIAAVAWWPWALLAFHRYWATRGIQWAICLGIILAAQAVSDVRYLAFSLVGLALATLIHARRRAPHVWLRTALVGWMAAGLVAVGLSSGQLLPGLVLLQHTSRGALSAAEASFGSLPPAMLLGALFPSKLEFPEWFLYPGIGALALALAGWALKWSRRETWWAVVACLGMLLTLGTYTPVYAGLYEWLPGLRLFRVPARWWLFTLFALVVLTSLGVQKWLDHGRIRKGRLVIGLAVLVFAYVGGLGLNLARGDLLPFRFSPHILTLLVVSLLLMNKPSAGRFMLLSLVVIADLWWVDLGLIRPMPEEALLAPDQATTEFLKRAAARGERSFAPYAGLPQAALVEYDLRAADGYDAYQLAGYSDFVQLASGCDFSGYAVSVPPMQTNAQARQQCPELRPNLPMLALLNVRYLVLPSPTHISGATLVFSDPASERWLYDIGPGVGRAFGVVQGKMVSPDACLEGINSIDPRSQALVEAPVPFAPGQPAPRVIAQESGINYETFRVHSQAGGLLIRSEAWAPGWRVRVDGVEQDVLRVDCALQGVWLGPGEHHVRFDYDPLGYRIGRWMSSVTVLLLLMGGWAAWVITRLRNAPGTGPEPAVKPKKTEGPEVP
jgi:hypothetical protein